MANNGDFFESPEHKVEAEILELRNVIQAAIASYPESGAAEKSAAKQLLSDIQANMALMREKLRDMELLADEQDTVEQTETLAMRLGPHKQAYEKIQQAYRTACLQVHKNRERQAIEERRELLGTGAAPQRQLKLESEADVVAASSAVTGSLQRTYHMLAEELEHTHATLAAMGTSNEVLRDVKGEFTGQRARIKRSHQLLSKMKRHSWLDFFALWGSLALFALVVLYIVTKRSAYFVPAGLLPSPGAVFGYLRGLARTSATPEGLSPDGPQGFPVGEPPTESPVGTPWGADLPELQEPKSAEVKAKDPPTGSPYYERPQPEEHGGLAAVQFDGERIPGVGIGPDREEPTARGVGIPEPAPEPSEGPGPAAGTATHSAGPIDAGGTPVVPSNHSAELLDETVPQPNPEVPQADPEVPQADSKVLQPGATDLVGEAGDSEGTPDDVKGPETPLRSESRPADFERDERSESLENGTEPGEVAGGPAGLGGPSQLQDGKSGTGDGVPETSGDRGAAAAGDRDASGGSESPKTGLEGSEGSGELADGGGGVEKEGRGGSEGLAETCSPGDLAAGTCGTKSTLQVAVEEEPIVDVNVGGMPAKSGRDPANGEGGAVIDNVGVDKEEEEEKEEEEQRGSDDEIGNASVGPTAGAVGGDALEAGSLKKEEGSSEDGDAGEVPKQASAVNGTEPETLEGTDVERLGIETGSADVSAPDFIPNPAKAAVSGDRKDGLQDTDVDRLGIETASGDITAPDFVPRPAGLVEPGLQGAEGTAKGPSGAAGTGSAAAETSESPLEGGVADFVNESTLGGVAEEVPSMREPWALGGTGTDGTATAKGTLGEEKAGTGGSGTAKDGKTEAEPDDADERAKEADLDGDAVADAEGEADDVDDAEGEERETGAGGGARWTEKDFGDEEEEDLESKNADTELGFFRDDVFLKDEL